MRTTDHQSPARGSNHPADDTVLLFSSPVMYVLCSFRGRYFYYVPNVLAMGVGRTEASSVRHGWDRWEGSRRRYETTTRTEPSSATANHACLCRVATPLVLSSSLIPNPLALGSCQRQAIACLTTKATLVAKTLPNPTTHFI